MMKKIATTIVISIVLTATTIAAPTVYNYTIAPSDLTAAGDKTDSTIFGWDWDQDAPVASTTVGGAPGYGNSAWYSDVQGSAAGGPRNYTALRIFADNALGLSDITVADLANISLWTNYESGINWEIKIYTASQTGDTGWYRNRISSYSAPTTSGWVQSDLDSLGIEWVYNKTDGSSTYTLTYDEVQALYGSETILYIDIIASYATNSPSSYAYLDGVELTAADGTVANINLVPEPTTMALLSLGGLLLRKRK